MLQRFETLNSLASKFIKLIASSVLVVAGLSLLSLSVAYADVKLTVEGVHWLDETKVRIDVRVANEGEIAVFLPSYPTEEGETGLSLHSLFVEAQQPNGKWKFVGPEGGDVPAPEAFRLDPGQEVKTLIVLSENQLLTWGGGRIRPSGAYRAKLSYFAGKEQWERYLLRQRDASVPIPKFRLALSKIFQIPVPTKGG